MLCACHHRVRMVVEVFQGGRLVCVPIMEFTQPYVHDRFDVALIWGPQ